MLCRIHDAVNSFCHGKHCWCIYFVNKREEFQIAYLCMLYTGTCLLTDRRRPFVQAKHSHMNMHYCVVFRSLQFTELCNCIIDLRGLPVALRRHNLLEALLWYIDAAKHMSNEASGSLADVSLS